MDLQQDFSLVKLQMPPIKVLESAVQFLGGSTMAKSYWIPREEVALTSLS